MTDAYSKAGVHIDLANETVARYKSILERHVDPRVLKGVGGFSGCFVLQGYRNAVLAASTDGVGTKVLVATVLRRYKTIGADLVNHCINDLLCSNAQPLFFLDYLAMGKLKPETAADIVGGIAEACRTYAVALLGGETAEMPGFYAPGEYDLAGFIVGVATETEPHAWQAFLVNFLFFFGVAQGGVMISGAFYLTQAKWGGSTPGSPDGRSR